jgi:hypothetical protein
LITFSNVVYIIFIFVVVVIFVARDGLSIPHLRTHSQRHIITITALLALRKPLQQRPKMRPFARPSR